MWRTANYVAMLSYFINVITYLENQGLFGICWRLFTVHSHCIYCFGTRFWQANRFATSCEKHLKSHLSKHSDSTVHKTGKSQMNDSYPIGLVLHSSYMSCWATRQVCLSLSIFSLLHPNFCFFFLLILHSTGTLFWPRHYGFIWPQLPTQDSQWSSQLRAWWPLIGRN